MCISERRYADSLLPDKFPVTVLKVYVLLNTSPVIIFHFDTIDEKIRMCSLKLVSLAFDQN